MTGVDDISIHGSSYCDIYDQRMETIYKDLEIFQTVSKKRSTIKLVSVLPGLPDLVIEKIFRSIEESYNTSLDCYGPEELPWLFVDQGDEVTEACYDAISEFYEYILQYNPDPLSSLQCTTIHTFVLLVAQEIHEGFGFFGFGIYEYCYASVEFNSKSSQLKLALTQLSGDTEEIEAECDSTAATDG